MNDADRKRILGIASLDDPIFIRTPILQSPDLNERLGKTVYFKMECYQPTRSFKLRGMAHLVRHHVRNGVSKFVASSGGNAGYSLAYACRRLGASAHVVVPLSTNMRMRRLIEGEDATVEVSGGSWQEAHEHAQQVAVATQAIYVSPFDNALLWTGHASMIDECALDIPEPELVVASVGGGGLMCGVMEGLERNAWKKSAFLAAETTGAASFARALEAGRVVTLAEVSSIATSLGAKAVSPRTLEWSARRTVLSYLCDDRQAVVATQSFADAFNVIVEPACGAALSAVFLPAPEVARAETVLVIACGGAGSDSAVFYEHLRRFGLLDSHPQ